MPGPLDAQALAAGEEREPASPEGGGPSPRLASVEVRRLLEDFVRRRAPASDVDDVVQTVLCEALASEPIPADREELRRWLIGIARHKVADLHRRASRETAMDLPDQPAPAPPIEARAMVGWAEKQAAETRDGQQTLGWMAREGEGDKLETIAADERLPAARVRQRVSRLRRFMKERWLAELAAVALLGLAALVAWRVLRGPKDAPDAFVPEPTPPIAPEPAPPVEETLRRARAMRDEALEECGRGAWRECLEGLDGAARLDAAGDAAPEVREARERARRAMDAPRLDLPEDDVKDSIAPTKGPAPRAPAPKPTMTPPSVEPTAPTSTATPSFTPKRAAPSKPGPSKKGPASKSLSDFDSTPMGTGTGTGGK